jgi:hypothetical protein
MHFRLRTLLTVLALAPPALAGLWLLLSDPLPVPLTELIVLATIAAAMTGSAALGAAAE